MIPGIRSQTFERDLGCGGQGVGCRGRGDLVTQALPPPQADDNDDIEEEEYYEDEEDDWEEDEEDDGKPEPNTGKVFIPKHEPFEIDGELNPLAVPDLSDVLNHRINQEAWDALKGDLPCVASTAECIEELQEMAVDESRVLSEIEERVSEARDLIDEARSNNKKAVKLSRLTPVLEYYLATGDPTSAAELERLREQYDFERSEFDRQQALASAYRQNQDVDPEIDRLSRAQFRPYRSPITPLARILGDITNPVRLFDNILNLVGVPIIQSIFGGGTPAQQKRSIEIGNLEIRVAELERGRIEAAQALREEVAAQVLTVDSLIADFQAQRALTELDRQRLAIAQIEYQYGVRNGYQAQRGTFNRQQAGTTKAWNDLRREMHRLQLLVFSALD